METYLGMRRLHFLVHLQGVMMKPHFNKNLQKSMAKLFDNSAKTIQWGKEPFQQIVLGRQIPHTKE